MSNFDDDPIKDLFDREREQIVPQLANDLHWQSIVHKGRVLRRSRFLGYAAGMTAAALVIGGVTYGALQQHDTAIVPAAEKSLQHNRTTQTPSTSATSAPAPTPKPKPTRSFVSRPPATTPEPTKPAAPAATEIVVLRPVTASGRPAPGYSVTNMKDTVTCGPDSWPSYVAVDDNIVGCGGSSEYAVACWKDAAPNEALCYRDPWSKKLDRQTSEGSIPTVTAPSQAEPFGLVLSDGDRCKIRVGGAWSSLTQHPNWVGAYFCTSGRAVWAPKPGKTLGINRASPSWTVNSARMSGTGPVKTLRVVQAYFIGTQGD